MKHIFFLLTVSYVTALSAVIICRNPFAASYQQQIATCCFGDGEKKTFSIVRCDGKMRSDCICKKTPSTWES